MAHTERETNRPLQSNHTSTPHLYDHLVFIQLKKKECRFKRQSKIFHHVFASVHQSYAPQVTFPFAMGYILNPYFIVRGQRKWFPVHLKVSEDWELDRLPSNKMYITSVT